MDLWKKQIVYIETLLNHLPDEAQLKIDRASTLIELGEEDEALLLLSEVKPEDEEYVQALISTCGLLPDDGISGNSA